MPTVGLEDMQGGRTTTAMMVVVLLILFMLVNRLLTVTRRSPTRTIWTAKRGGLLSPVDPYTEKDTFCGDG
jgi:hypothetical protein